MLHLCLLQTASDFQVHSRSPSQLSHNGSSGYGSTRSHVGPHISQNQSGQCTVPKKQYGSMRGQKPEAHETNLRQLPQFHSMRLLNIKSPQVLNSSCMPNSNNVPKNQKTFELHAMPIKENTETKSYQNNETSELKEPNNNSSATVDESSGMVENLDKATSESREDKDTRRFPPVPAPRAQVSKPKHTYQNVPIPISPNAQEMPKVSL